MSEIKHQFHVGDLVVLRPYDDVQDHVGISRFEWERIEALGALEVRYTDTDSRGRARSWLLNDGYNFFYREHCLSLAATNATPIDDLI